jgi:hypothetical protein
MTNATSISRSIIESADNEDALVEPRVFPDAGGYVRFAIIVYAASFFEPAERRTSSKSSRSRGCHHLPPLMTILEVMRELVIV